MIRAPQLLSNVRVLAVEQYGAGPFGTQLLSGMGAEIIKIENATEGGDVGRSIGPHFASDLPETTKSYFYQSLNLNKKSVTLNMSRPEGRELFRKLAGKADAVVTNLRGDVAAKLGLSYSDLAEANPKIVCAHLSGYGRTGERAKWPGYDYLMQAEAGYFSLTGEEDGAPSRMGLSLVDYMAGAVLALGLTSGLLRARDTGIGMDVDLSLYDLAVYNLNYVAAWYLNTGKVTTRINRSAHPSLTPCQTYRTADGWIYLMCNKEKFWPLLCELIGASELGTDPRFATFKDRFRERPEITRLLDEHLSKKTTGEWMEIFGGKIPASPILDVGQALENPFLLERGGVGEIETPEGGSLRFMASPILAAGPDVTPTPATLAPVLGQNTDEILGSIGLCADDIARLRQEGII